MTNQNNRIPEDFITHEASWRAAIEYCIKMSPEASIDRDDKAYWQHELRAFDRAYTELKKEFV